jgi:hypothetical protein
VNFYDWLMRQAHRNDDVGTLADYAHDNPAFPRTRRLYILLKSTNNPILRSCIKTAHREWRKSR